MISSIHHTISSTLSEHPDSHHILVHAQHVQQSRSYSEAQPPMPCTVCTHPPTPPHHTPQLIRRRPHRLPRRQRLRQRLHFLNSIDSSRAAAAVLRVTPARPSAARPTAKRPQSELGHGHGLDVRKRQRCQKRRWSAPNPSPADCCQRRSFSLGTGHRLLSWHWALKCQPKAGHWPGTGH